MRMTTRRLFGAAALLALSATGLLGGTASASPEKPAPPPGDPRATSFSGNVEWDHDKACATAGLAGEAFDDEGTPTLANTSTGTHLTITGGLEGYTVTGVVVKGGDAYNVYTAAKLGDLAWEGLHAPEHQNKGGAGTVPEISHWFFCAEKTTSEQTTTPESPNPENPGEETPVEETPAEETEEVVPTTESVAVTPTATTTPAPAAGANDGDLANTGFDGGWLLAVGLALVAAGAAFVASPKLRHLLRR
ncbi:hypothetical protein AB0K14_10640 [Actinosynnema sp. NPDC050801]|uniref:hypothetical protein n=1 Tax=unclassified Actinosynnema TaxID=2637065 RepID=UPI0033E36850